MEQLYGEMPRVHDFGCSGFGEYGFFWHVCVLGHECYHAVGKFSNVRHLDELFEIVVNITGGPAL